MGVPENQVSDQFNNAIAWFCVYLFVAGICLGILSLFAAKNASRAAALANEAAMEFQCDRAVRNVHDAYGDIAEAKMLYARWYEAHYKHDICETQIKKNAYDMPCEDLYQEKKKLDAEIREFLYTLQY